MFKCLSHLAVILVLVGCGTDKPDCEKAGGACAMISPGVCLGQFIADSEGYACGSSQVCCLPLSHSPCEVAGGTCENPGGCEHGTVSPVYVCSNAGGPTECCMPHGDGGG